MSKKRSKPRKPGSSRGAVRALRTARSPAAELARLRGSFFAWVTGSGLPASVDPALLWRDVVATVELAVDRAGLTDLHHWTTEQIGTLAGDADASDALAALPLLLAFLAETGRWNGSPAELHTVLSAAEEAVSPVAGVLAALAEVDVDPTFEDAALRALPVVAQAEDLIRFCHPRRPVTATGALRRADVAPAAELVGIDPARDLSGRTPRSMWDIPRLAALWQAACDAGLLVVSSREVTPTPLAHGWVTGDAEQGARSRRLLVEAYLAELLTAPAPAPWLPHPLEALLPALATAALGRPMPTALALGQPVPGTEDCGDPDCPVHGPAAGDEVESALFPSLIDRPVQRLLDQLADDGIVHVTDTVTAAPGLHGVLARFASTMLQEEQSADELPAPDPDLAGQAFRLRVELEDAAPPIWREVLVDPAIPLDHLHEVIQRLFAWEDYHLHEFIAVRARNRTARFGPADRDQAPFGEPAADESATRLSHILAPGKGSLRYRYDFGDGWDHRITVLGAQPADGPLPRCTGGAGAAPEEDSGGVWGWMEKVQAAGDPRHPEHADVRDWLGLSSGETLDPATFDPAEVEKRLAGLRDVPARGASPTRPRR